MTTTSNNAPTKSMAKKHHNDCIEEQINVRGYLNTAQQIEVEDPNALAELNEEAEGMSEFDQAFREEEERIISWFKGDKDPLSYIENEKDAIQFANFIMLHSHYEFEEDSCMYIAEGALLKLCILYLLRGYERDSFRLENVVTFLEGTNLHHHPEDQYDMDEDEEDSVFNILYKDAVENKDMKILEHYYKIAANTPYYPIYVIANHVIDRIDDVIRQYDDKQYYGGKDEKVVYKFSFQKEVQKTRKKIKEGKVSKDKNDVSCVVKRTSDNRILFLPKIKTKEGNC